MALTPRAGLKAVTEDFHTEAAAMLRAAGRMTANKPDILMLPEKTSRGQEKVHFSVSDKHWDSHARFGMSRSLERNCNMDGKLTVAACRLPQLCGMPR
jgi:hypothetical protein